ncbi:MAG: HisA/HisF-related TIM barrel protein, partial [Halobacteriota archaeon]
GVKTRDDVREIEHIANTVIIGTETASLDVITATQSANVGVSIDMRGSRVVSADPALAGDPLEIIEEMNLYNLKELLLLNLDLVGTKHGIDRNFIENAVNASGHPIIVAGGVKSSEDLDMLEDLGVAGVILSTAIHEGIIPVEVVR